MKTSSHFQFAFILMLSLFSFISEGLNAKVLILTHSYNRPEFISWQYETLKKFVEDEYEFIVFNDAPNQELFNQIQEACEALNITSISVPQIIHSLPYLARIVEGGPSAECADTIQYMLNTLGFRYPGLVVILDSDMFIIRKLNIENSLKNYEIAAHPQYREGLQGNVIYFLPNLMFFNMQELIDKESLNFNLGIIDGARVDTGGYTYYYIEQHPHLKWLQTNCTSSPFNEEASNLSPEIISNLKSHKKLFQLMMQMKYDYEFYMDYTFMHFRAGSNWYYRDAKWMEGKTKLLCEAIEQLIQDP